jgi:hypothetical protein
MPSQDAAPVSGVFPADGELHLLEIGIQTIKLSPYHAGPAAHRLRRLSATTAFLTCCCPLHLSDPDKPSDPGTSLRVPPDCAGNTTQRLVAHRYLHAKGEAQCPRSPEVTGSKVGSLITIFVQAVAIALIVAVLTALH